MTKAPLLPIAIMAFAVAAFLLLIDTSSYPESTTVPRIKSNQNTNATAENSNANTNQSTNQNANTNTSSEPTANWKTYTNTTLGFSLKYPETWVFQVTDHISGAETPSGERVVFWSQANWQSQLPEASEWVPTEDLYQFIVRYDDNTRDEYKQNPEVIQLVKTEAITVGGETGTKDTFNGPFNTYTTVYVTHNGIVYGLTIPQLTAEQRTIAELMLESFTFTD